MTDAPQQIHPEYVHRHGMGRLDLFRRMSRSLRRLGFLLPPETKGLRLDEMDELFGFAGHADPATAGMAVHDKAPKVNQVEAV